MSMHDDLLYAFELEMSKAKEAFHSTKLDLSFKHLERAHVLGQMNVIAHTRAHIWMFKVALKRKDFAEMFAQSIRIPSGIVGSFLGVVPLGNTGGGNVSAIKPMDISEDLRSPLEYSATMEEKMNRNAQYFLRFALAACFLSAVADRVGLWGNAGEPGVVWGNMKAFLDYTHLLLPWMPRALSDVCGYIATFLEVILSVFLLIGFRLKESSLASFFLLLSFILSMSISFGVKSSLDYSVITAAAGAFLLFSINLEKRS
ncbi:putative membrane protein [Halobacteriovorax marinus SJ]|uniref:Membrane protein n=2 Tax=Halobacteriovorax marinus TaxID=97084 RepID=E1X5F7_HALMS|nr:putative membrane protein [Halobacteriovorax marinus SJ]